MAMITKRISMAAATSTWCDLCEDTLELILKSPGMTLSDLITCFDVCVSWRSTIKRMINRDPSLQLIKLMFFDKKHNIENKFFGICLPITFNARNYMSSCRGWILSSAINPNDEFCHKDLRLFNPWTKATLELPPSPLSYSKSPFKFVLNSSPLESTCKIYLLDKNLRRLAFWKQGMASWELCAGRPSCDDIIFYENEIVGVNYRSELGIYGGYPVEDAAAHYPRTSSRYLVESVAGDLLVVVRYMEWETTDSDSIIDEYKTIGFEVYRRKARKWEEVTSLGDQAVFLAHYDSRFVAARDLTASKPNCIYFVDDSMEGYYPAAGGDCGVFDMESRTIQQNSESYGFNKWFRPEN